MKNNVADLANRAHALRKRIALDERALAIAYPDKVAELQKDLDGERALLAELEPKIEKAKESARTALLAAIEDLFAARANLLRLNGYFMDPGFTDSIFAKVVLGVEPAQDALGLKAVLMAIAEMPPAQMPELPDVQRLQDERLKNERAELGFYSDDELRRKAENPIGFAHGLGAKEVRVGVVNG